MSPRTVDGAVREGTTPADGTNGKHVTGNEWFVRLNSWTLSLTERPVDERTLRASASSIQDEFGFATVRAAGRFISRISMRSLVMALRDRLRRTTTLVVLTTWAGTAAAVSAAAQEPPPTATPSPAPEDTGPKAPIVVRDHRTIRSFPANLGHNMLEVWTLPSLKPFLIGGTLTAASLPLDDNVVEYFDKHPMKTYGNVGKFLGTGVVAVGVSAAILGFGHRANGDRFRAASYDMSQAVVVNFLYTLAIKEAVQRPRPDGSDNLSFPSGHASNAFACATVWAEQYGWKGAVPGYLAASFVAGSRLALKKHRLSDVVAGATLGIIVGRSVVRWDAKPSNKPLPHEKQVTFGPATAADGSGLGLRVDVTF
jgi:membrane-associated phospholipid phosphatase